MSKWQSEQKRKVWGELNTFYDSFQNSRPENVGWTEIATKISWKNGCNDRVIEGFSYVV